MYVCSCAVNSPCFDVHYVFFFLFCRPDNWQFYVQYFNSLFQLVDMQWTPEVKTVQIDQANVISSAEDCVSSAKTNGESTEEPGTGSGDNEAADKEDSKRTGASVAVNADDNNKASVIDYTPQMALTFINSQVNFVTADNVRPLRGPFLAKLELLKRIKQREKNELVALNVESAVDLLEQYYQCFGDKSCCFSDLRPYMELLQRSQQLEVRNLLFDHAQSKKPLLPSKNFYL